MKKETLFLHKNIHTTVNKIFICNSPKLETEGHRGPSIVKD